MGTHWKPFKYNKTLARAARVVGSVGGWRGGGGGGGGLGTHWKPSKKKHLQGRGWWGGGGGWRAVGAVWAVGAVRAEGVWAHIASLYILLKHLQGTPARATRRGGGDSGGGAAGGGGGGGGEGGGGTHCKYF